MSRSCCPHCIPCRHGTKVAETVLSGWKAPGQELSLEGCNGGEGMLCCNCLVHFLLLLLLLPSPSRPRSCSTRAAALTLCLLRVEAPGRQSSGCFSTGRGRGDACFRIDAWQTEANCATVVATAAAAAAAQASGAAESAAQASAAKLPSKSSSSAQSTRRRCPPCSAQLL